MVRFEKEILNYIRAKHMLPAGSTVTLGVSGGADSVCLLTVLHRLQRILDLRLQVVHVNHGLRAEAAEDAAFVKELCERLEVPFTLVEADVKALAKEKGISLEEAGRVVRYQAFRDAAGDRVSASDRGSGTLSGLAYEALCQTEGPDSVPDPLSDAVAEPVEAPADSPYRIATAHTATDLAETVLLNLFRGSGLRGAAGILPVNGNIVRPLLNTSREDIEAYLQAEGIAWVEDETNAADDYARNRVRHHILPLATKEVNAQAVRHLAKAAETFALTDAYMQEEARRVLEETDSSLPLSSFISAPLLLQQEIIRAAIAEVAPHLKDISRRHIDAVLDLCRNDYGTKSLDLPDGVRIIRRYGTLFFCKKGDEMIQ